MDKELIVVLGGSDANDSCTVLACLLEPRGGRLNGTQAENGHAWSGISSSGRKVLVGGGILVPRPGLSLEEALIAQAGRVDNPVSRFPEIAAAMVSGMRGWSGGKAAGRDRFVASCGRAAFDLAGAGARTEWLAVLDASYGRDRVDAVLTRSPALGGALWLASDAEAGPEARAARDGLMRPGTVPLHEAARHVAALLAERAPSNKILRHLPPSGREAAGRQAWEGRLGRYLKAMGSIPVDPRQAAAAMLTCARVPVDWMPHDARGTAAMAQLCEVALGLEAASDGSLRFEDLIAPVRGRWIEAEAAFHRINPGVRHLVDPWLREVRDMARAYQSQVLGPARAYALLLTGVPAESAPLGDSAGYAALFSGKGLLAVAEANARWHQVSAAMNGAICTARGSAGSAFPRPFPDFVASNGCIVRPILTARDLVDEGAHMSHCVGGRIDDCRSSACAIASVRSPAGVRLSTVEIERGVVVVEHQGHANSLPPKAAVEAVAECTARNAGIGRISPGRLLLPRTRALLLHRVRELAALWDPGSAADLAYDPRDPAEILRAAALWQPFVPRPQRGSLEAILAPYEPSLATAVAGRDLHRIRSTWSDVAARTPGAVAALVRARPRPRQAVALAVLAVLTSFAGLLAVAVPPARDMGIQAGTPAPFLSSAAER